jgi:ABC-type polysaccharide/polyol phosphate export permease
MTTLLDTLHIAWVIGSKDIVDALKNKASRINLVVMVFMVFFFCWLNVLRPFDRGVSVVVFDQGTTSKALDSATLANGAKYTFRKTTSLQEMERLMVYQDLGLVLPSDLDQVLADGGTPVLKGYVFWTARKQVPALEARFSQALGELLGHTVQVAIGGNIIVPQADADGMHANTAHLLIYFIFFTALGLIPHLMLEEKRTKTMNALLVSPASAAQIVLGKALAGLFYILVVGGLAVALFSAFIVNWVLALVALLGYALFAVGLGLAVGSFITSSRQLGFWIVVLMLVIAIPPIFFMESNLKAGIRMILTWFPSSALASLFRYACSTGVTGLQYWTNLAVATASIAIVFGLVIWKVRRSDR